MSSFPVYTARDSKIGSARVGQPQNLGPACIAQISYPVHLAYLVHPVLVSLSCLSVRIVTILCLFEFSAEEVVDDLGGGFATGQLHNRADEEGKSFVAAGFKVGD